MKNQTCSDYERSSWTDISALKRVPRTFKDTINKTALEDHCPFFFCTTKDFIILRTAITLHVPLCFQAHDQSVLTQNMHRNRGHRGSPVRGDCGHLWCRTTAQWGAAGGHSLYLEWGARSWRQVALLNWIRAAPDKFPAWWKRHWTLALSRNSSSLWICAQDSYSVAWH